MIRPLRVLWFCGLFGFGVVSLLAYKRRIDPVSHERFSSSLRGLQALDAELNGEVMQSRQALVTHYDAIVATTRRVRLGLRGLEPAPAFLPEPEIAEIERLVESARSAAADKERAIEIFKSENAVLRNSVRYFPTGALELRDRLAATPDDPAAARLGLLVNELLRSVLHFNQLPGPDLEARARRALDEVLAAAPVPVALGDAGVVAKHARIVLDRRDRVDAQTQAIFDIPSRLRLDALEARYAAAYQRALAEADARRIALFLLAVAVLVLVSADIITHLRRVAASERAASDQRAAANQALIREKEKERELMELKNRFVSMTSHEFRTPLSVILSSTELLEAYSERWSASKRADHFRRIKAAIRGMTDLLDGVLVIGRADAGRLVCSPGPVDLHRFCAELGDALQPSLSADHTWESETVGDTHDVWLDEKLLNHILTNLLSNAVKYSPEGGKVRFSTKVSPDLVRFEVEDEGIGIPKEEESRLFDSFHRCSNVGHIAGTGLGLAVVKRAVEAHGGELALERPAAKGSRFVVTLPRGRAPRGTSEAPARPAPSSPEEPSSATG